jgi:hypothetical protein
MNTLPQKSTRPYNPEDKHRHIYRCENVKYHIQNRSQMLSSMSVQIYSHAVLRYVTKAVDITLLNKQRILLHSFPLP